MKGIRDQPRVIQQDFQYDNETEEKINRDENEVRSVLEYFCSNDTLVLR